MREPERLDPGPPCCIPPYKRPTVEYSLDGGKTWDATSWRSARQRCSVKAADALNKGEVERAVSRDGLVIYRRKAT